MLSGLESELKDRWLKLVRRYFVEEFDEDIDASYLKSFREHGLVLSRYSQGKLQCQLRPVTSSKYFAKIMGYDPKSVYGGDKEVTADTIKESKIPFDLLREVTAANVDLWAEYAISLKGVACFRFSKGLESRVKKFFEDHPDKNPINDNCPKESVIATLEH